MSTPVVFRRPPRLPVWRRAAPLLAVGFAFLLARLRPDRLRQVLRTVARRAKPATVAQASAARAKVTSVSLRCATEHCLQRSIAAALLCRLGGAWPTFCTGVRTAPFAAHAWIEVDGEPIDEPTSTAGFHVLIRI
ncbi:lasso peptide biosynthesis B2 protein [Fodinicola acaciae]|uniref:lasso peptide biosynthesis B2 protein n=1 Tax=Fodinicola acaciae TaxID=2681555 RepID=UPI0013D1352B|nr:lasso peptide biosynthesis B2 protein [Fodinicola acaciae]